MDRLTSLESALASAHDDRDRLTTALGRLDADRAGAELKSALRQGSSDPAHVALVTSLRERYESIHRVANRRDQLDQAIERALVDAELLAARSVELGAGVDAWELDDTVGRLADDLTALELAHAELDDL